MIYKVFSNLTNTIKTSIFKNRLQNELKFSLLFHYDYKLKVVTINPQLEVGPVLHDLWVYEKHPYKKRLVDLSKNKKRRLVVFWSTWMSQPLITYGKIIIKSKQNS